MQYPRRLMAGDTIGVCAPSNGVSQSQFARLDQAERNLEAMGYRVKETDSVRKSERHVSADAKTRVKEFMALYEDPQVGAIIPPWGGEFLMEMLPLLDMDRIRSLPPKWVSGYSDVSLLNFALTLACDVATIHGSNLMNIGWRTIHASDMAMFEAMRSQEGFVQKSADFVGSFDQYNDLDAAPYMPSVPGSWKSLEDAPAAMSGRVIGGCFEVLRSVIGTAYAPIEPFIDKYRKDGILWVLESCESKSADAYRTLWQMREAGWFDGCSGFIIGRPDGVEPDSRYAYAQALRDALAPLGMPVLYDADVGHIPPQMQFINGAIADVSYADGAATVTQRYLP